MVQSDGSTASYYELPPGNPTELQELIAYKNMNAQLGEAFREIYRYGEASHCDKLRGINKIIFYALAEKERLLKYELEPEELRRVRQAEGKSPCMAGVEVAEHLEEIRERAEATESKGTQANQAAPQEGRIISNYEQRAREEQVRKESLAMKDAPGAFNDRLRR